MKELKTKIANRIINNAHILGSHAETVKRAHKFIMNTKWSTVCKRGETANIWNRDKQSKESYVTKAQNKRNKKYVAIIPLGNDSENEVERAIKKQHPQRKNWETTQAERSEYGPNCNTIDHGRYSSRCTFTHYTYRPVIGSWAFIKGDSLEFHYTGKISILLPPSGYSWKKDANGIHIISTDGKKDYHPDSDDLRNYSKSDIRAKALNNYKIRKEELKQQKRNLLLIKKAEKEGAMICLKDSIRSGNCQVGTINFANRHNLNPQKHYPPTQLLKIANGQADRVAIAVAVGLRRHYREMRQGFCEIANHI